MVDRQHGGADATAARLTPLVPVRARRARGFALVGVIWVVGMLALIAAEVARATRSEAGITNGLIAIARVQAATDGAVRRAIFALVTRAQSPSKASAATPRDGTPRTIEDGDVTVSVAIQDETGLVDLNMAPIELLTSLFAHVGGGTGSPERLARAVVAWRTRGGAGVLPPGVPPPNPLQSALEIAALDGATPDLARALLPFVTVQGRSVGVDPMTAPLTVLRSLPGVDPEEAAAFVARRHDPADGAAAPPPPRNVGRWLVLGGGDAVRILAHGEGAGAVAERIAIVRLGGTAGEPYRVLGWFSGFGG